jgi:2-(1,2-epoxy-1,2-dihydrophenyl)acetyl-CoA isomerase
MAVFEFPQTGGEVMEEMSLYNELLDSGRSAEEGAVVVERPEADRAIVTLNEPDRLNPLSAALCVQLGWVLEDLAVEREVRTIILTGRGSAFSAGGDMEMMRRGSSAVREGAGSPDVWRWIRNQFGGVVRTIARSDKAYVAALNGPAAGVGLAFALTCDVAIAARGATLVPAFGMLGLLPEVGTSWALTRRLGYQGAFAFFVEGRHIGAEEALEKGLVNEVVEPVDLLAAAARWADKVASLPDHALEMGKTLLRSASDLGWEESVRMEEFAEPNCFTTESFASAVRRFAGGSDGDRTE